MGAGVYLCSAMISQNWTLYVLGTVWDVYLADSPASDSTPLSPIHCFFFLPGASFSQIAKLHPVCCDSLLDLPSVVSSENSEALAVKRNREHKLLSGNEIIQGRGGTAG